MTDIPEFLKDMIKKQYGEDVAQEIFDGYIKKRNSSFRINTLKANKEEITKILDENNIKYSDVSFYDGAILLLNDDEDKIKKMDIYADGKIYFQSLSSMLPAVILNPCEGDNILDMAAAPGGKTTQMLAMSKGKAYITACEKNKIRADRMKFNIAKQGAESINVLVEDARKLDDYFSFDKILLDAPCSGSGTINLCDKECNITEELINRSAKTQYDLLKKAMKILKKGSSLVYSTCSILSKENEENVLKILKEYNAKIVPINENITKDIPLLHSQIEGTVCVKPSKLYEGFFVAMIQKMK